VTLGASTLVLPFGTLFFSHLLAAALAFSAFALLWGGRAGLPRVAAAGLLCGFGISTENSILLASLVLGVYACVSGPRLRRAAAAFVLANAMSPDLLGGASPGPRYLIPAFPFLALGLALAYRRFPGEAIGLAAGGALMLGAATITSPLGAFDQHVIHRLRAHSFVASVLELFGIKT